MSELAGPRTPLEEHISTLQELWRPRGVIELTLERLEERHFGLLRIRPP